MIFGPMERWRRGRGKRGFRQWRALICGHLRHLRIGTLDNAVQDGPRRFGQGIRVWPVCAEVFEALRGGRRHDVGLALHMGVVHGLAVIDEVCYGRPNLAR